MAFCVLWEIFLNLWTDWVFIRVKCAQLIQVNCQYRILSLWHMEIHTVVHCLLFDKSQRFKWAVLKAITDRLRLGQRTAADFQKFWKNLFNPYRARDRSVIDIRAAFEEWVHCHVIHLSVNTFCYNYASLCNQGWTFFMYGRIRADFQAGFFHRTHSWKC